jgi:hypothetical protein
VGDERSAMNRSGLHENVAAFRLGDEWRDLAVDFSADEAFELWHFPIETVSQSESGFERTYQGTAVALSHRFHLAQGETKRVNLRLTLGRLRAGIAAAVDPDPPPADAGRRRGRGERHD